MIVVNFGVNKVLMTVPKGAGKVAGAGGCDDMVITAVSQWVSIMHLEPFQVLVLPSAHGGSAQMMGARPVGADCSALHFAVGRARVSSCAPG
jgi:hypothetical protein